jgi:hypothetical protein
MTNPFDPAYLTAVSSSFGPLAWVFFLLQIAILGTGIYFGFIRKARDTFHQGLFSQLGIALMIAGGIGVVLGVLRLLNVGVFNQRYWFYLHLAIELGVAGYIAYYLRVVYPPLAARRPQRGSRQQNQPARKAIPQASSNGAPGSDQEPRPAAGGRRSARRDRKRKNR